MPVTKKSQTENKSKTKGSQNSKTGLSIAAKNLGIQPKLTIGQPNDKYEQEADSIADKVMLMPERGTIQRKCNGCEQEDVSSVALAKDEKIQQKRLSTSIIPWVQKRATGENENSTPSLSLESQLNSSKSGGSPLPKTTRSFMENGIGANLSNVKIHTDNNAIQMSQELGAQAFAHGNHVYFNSGKYNPSSSQGKHLLAHELVHTVQHGKSAKKEMAQTKPMPPDHGKKAYEQFKNEFDPLSTGLNHSFVKYLTPKQARRAYEIMSETDSFHNFYYNKVILAETWGFPFVQNFISPVNGSVSSTFNDLRGLKKTPHGGLDIAGNKGFVILSVASGRIVRSGIRGGYGESVEIDHGFGISSLYAHMKKNTIGVKIGQHISKGLVLGLVGNTGFVKGLNGGYHLHFEIRKNGIKVDPLKYLNKKIQL
ncbi:MAG: DUF4157 domain-containing protein [Crocinitomix sp.]|nr:DUF4157 domain-containing protein [Crocinitomix sp.]